MQSTENKNNSSEITLLVEDLEAVLEMNKLLEKENQELRNEVGRLKAQISSLKAHDFERKSTLWKKIQQSENLKVDLGVETVTRKKPELQERDSVLKGPPPPPPPLPSKLLVGSKFTVRRVPDVIEFYRYLNKRNAQMVSRANNVTATGIVEGNNPRNMIGEIEHRSTYLSAVKSDVETQREFINNLIREVETASFSDISKVEAFVKWVDGELSCLVDERAVLKHFPKWPERKADALREASCTYREMKVLEAEVVSYHDNSKQPLSHTLRKIQSLQDRLEQATNNIERTREGTCKRYKELQVPWDWMMDTGLVGQIKLSSLRLAREYMNRIIKELHDPKCSKVEDVILHGARFAYRVHQFAGGFDLDTKHMFEELKRIHSTKSLQAN